MSNSVPPAQKSEPTPCIRRATPADVPAIVQLQTICQPHFHLADPGPAFLRSFYSFVLHDHRGIAVRLGTQSQAGGFRGRLCRPLASLRENRIPKASYLCDCFRSAWRAPDPTAQVPRRPPQGSPSRVRARLLQRNRVRVGRHRCPASTEGEGHGKALILALVEAAKCNKMDQLRVHIGSNDTGMALFYGRLGFQPVRTFWSSDTRWLDEYVLTIQRNGKVILISIDRRV